MLPASPMLRRAGKAGNGLVEIVGSGVYNKLFVRVFVSAPAVLLRKSEAAGEP